MVANFLGGRNDFYGISKEMLMDRLAKISVVLSNLSPKAKIPATVLGVKLLTELSKTGE